MSASLTLPDGSTRALTLYPACEALEVRERNPGLPDAWGQGWTPGAPVLFDSWQVTAPGRTLLYGSAFGATVSGDTWTLAHPSDFHYRANRNGVPIWPALAGHHAILPGDTLYARFVPADDPWELRMLAAIPGQAVARALAVLDFDEARIARWPWLQKMLGLYKFDATSLDPSTPPGHRDAAWLLNPPCFMRRWSAQPDGLPALAHWYGLGTRQAGVSLTNEHYGSDAAWIGQGLRASDHRALTIGLYLLRAKIAYGLIDCDTACKHRGKWRTESGDNVRGTQGMVPSWAKEYDRGLAAASVLLPNDDFIQCGAQLRRSYLLTAGHEWTGSGGARNIGHYLENLWHWYVATGDPAFMVKAEAEIAFALAKCHYPWFPENPGSMTVSAGEGLLALAMCRRWMGPTPQTDAMLAWTLANCWDPATGRCGYFVDASHSPATITWGGHFQGLNWMQLDLPPAARAKIEAYMFTHYANAADCDAAFGGEGPAFEKWLPWLVTYGATR